MQSIGVLIFVILVGLLVYMCIGGNKVKVRRSGNSITVITKDRTVEYNYSEVI